MCMQSKLILGLPINNLSMKEVLSKILSMIDEYKKDQKPRQIATVNVDFLVNCLGWIPGNVRHPELLNILRNSDLLTADGMPIVWLSKLLGNKLKERVTGADLVFKISEMASNNDLSIFLLGASNDVANVTKKKLLGLFPNLKIKGTLSPNVTIKIEDIAENYESDRKIIEHINQSDSDILLIAFGNPKQELWYARNRHLIQVPVSIGVGGSFEFVAGTVKRAPILFQKLGFEWIFRLLMEPKRLWKRYLIGMLKFSFMAAPVVLYQLLGNFLSKLNYKITKKNIKELCIKSEKSSSSVLRLPSVLNVNKSNEISEVIEQLSIEGQKVTLDFRDVSYIDISFMGYLLDAYYRYKKLSENLIISSPSKYTINIMKLNRIWDIFESRSDTNIIKQEKPSKLSSYNKPFSFNFEVSKNYTILSLSGTLDQYSESANNFPSITENIDSHNLIINLKDLNYVDSTGLTQLFNIQKKLENVGRNCVFCSLQKNVKQMFSIFKLDSTLNISKNLISAEKIIDTQT